MKREVKRITFSAIKVGNLYHFQYESGHNEILLILNIFSCGDKNKITFWENNNKKTVLTVDFYSFADWFNHKGAYATDRYTGNITQLQKVWWIGSLEDKRKK